MENRQTAVQWLIEQFERQRFIEKIDFDTAIELEKQQLTDLVQQLKDYTRESQSILGNDEREASEFVDIFLETFNKPTT